MPKLSPTSAKKLIKILLKLNFILVRQKGSHARYVHDDGRKITVPIHDGEKIGKGLLRKIINDLGLTVEDFQNLK